MLPAQREAVILSLLQQQPAISVQDICTQCDCSPITARRDLARLEEQGLLRRTHGGAIAVTRTRPLRQMPRLASPEARLSLLDRSDVLMVTPASTSGTRLLVERARRAGVPIIAESMSYPGATTVVAIDDYRAGVELGHWVGEYVQRDISGDVNVLDLTTSLPNTATRSRGFADGLRQVLPGGGILLSVDGAGLRDQARQMVTDVLAVHPEINVIFAINDDSALGALDAYRAVGLDERKLLLVSFGLEGAASQ